jgi:hypothetical protein
MDRRALNFKVLQQYALTATFDTQSLMVKSG